MRDGTLIIGGSLAGLQAALDLADSGVVIQLVERTPFLVDQDHNEDIPPHLFNKRALEVIRHPNITVWNNTDISQFEPHGDFFQVEILQKPRCIDILRCIICIPNSEDPHNTICEESDSEEHQHDIDELNNNQNDTFTDLPIIDLSKSREKER